MRRKRYANPLWNNNNDSTHNHQATTTIFTTTTLAPQQSNNVTTTFHLGKHDTISNVDDLEVYIEGPSSGYDHWRWKLNASFPTSGVAGGNPVHSGTTTQLTGLTPGTHTIYVALADSNGNVTYPLVSHSKQIVIVPSKFVLGNVPNWNQPKHYEANGHITNG